MEKSYQDQTNSRCIMLEGLFNTLGHDIIGMTTIVPLFITAQSHRVYTKATNRRVAETPNVRH